MVMGFVFCFVSQIGGIMGHLSIHLKKNFESMTFTLVKEPECVVHMYISFCVVYMFYYSFIQYNSVKISGADYNYWIPLSSYCSLPASCSYITSTCFFIPFSPLINCWRISLVIQGPEFVIIQYFLLPFVSLYYTDE